MVTFKIQSYSRLKLICGLFFSIYRVFIESSQAPFFDLQGFYWVKPGPLFQFTGFIQSQARPPFSIYRVYAESSRIMYLMGGLDRYNRPIYRPIQRSIHRSILDRHLVETRSSIRRYIGGVSTDVSTDSLLNDTQGVGRHIDRDTINGISVNYRLYIGQLSVKSRSTLDRLSSEIRPITC